MKHTEAFFKRGAVLTMLIQIMPAIAVILVYLLIANLALAFAFRGVMSTGNGFEFLI